ncbi:S1C family serine protease [Serratia sp. NA_112.1]|uniref:S1C family serine protease n=1 Tax=unclassified Serratia (in: enterobacteria) TaxID=2647522 RepID=UPI004046F34B
MGTAGKKSASITLSSHAAIGDVALAIGNPYNLLGSATQGIISAVDRISRQSSIQTDASINKGNSGGLLLNTAGEMVGLTTLNLARIPGTQGINGLGFALPTPLVNSIMKKLLRDSTIIRGCLGLDVAEGIRPAPDGTVTALARVLKVNPSGVADNTGIQEGDLLTTLTGQPITHVQQALDLIADRPPGSTLSLTVEREGSLLTKNVVVEKCTLLDNRLAPSTRSTRPGSLNSVPPSVDAMAHAYA